MSYTAQKQELSPLLSYHLASPTAHQIVDHLQLHRLDRIRQTLPHLDQHKVLLSLYLRHKVLLLVRLNLLLVLQLLLKGLISLHVQMLKPHCN